MKNPKNQVRLENVYITTNSSLYVTGKYALILRFHNPYSNGNGEIRLYEFSFFEYDKEDMENTIREDGSNPKSDILISESELNGYIEQYKALNEEAVELDLYNFFIVPCIDAIEVVLKKDDNPFFEKGLIEFFNEIYRDKYYKDGIYPKILKIVLE